MPQDTAALWRDYSCLQLDKQWLRHLPVPLAASVQEAGSTTEPHIQLQQQQDDVQQTPEQPRPEQLQQEQKQHKDQLISDLVAGMVGGLWVLQTKRRPSCNTCNSTASASQHSLSPWP